MSRGHIHVFRITHVKAFSGQKPSSMKVFESSQQPLHNLASRVTNNPLIWCSRPFFFPLLFGFRVYSCKVSKQSFDIFFDLVYVFIITICFILNNS